MQVLRLYRIAAIFVGNPRRDAPLRDVVDALGSHVQWTNGTESPVDTLDDVAEIALVPGSVGADGEPALHSGIG